jgi:hypothetical protein
MRIEDPEINPPNYSHLIFKKGTKNMLEKRQSIHKMETGHPHPEDLKYIPVHVQKSIQDVSKILM